MYKLLLPLLLALFMGCSQIPQSSDPFPDFLLQWKVISNQEKDVPESHALLRITNQSKTDTLSDDWKLFFNHAPRKVRKVEGPAHLTQISGDYYALIPKKGFQLQPGDSMDIHYYMAAWLIKESDGPRGTYLVFPKRADSIQERLGYRTMPFEGPEQIHRYKNDEEPIPTAQWQYEYNQKFGFVEVEEEEEWVDLGDTIGIAFDGGLENEAEYLADALKSLTGFSINLNESNPEKADISLQLASDKTVPESYILQIRDGQAKVQGGTAQGVFYGIQDLIRQIDLSSSTPQTLTLKIGSISDHPRFSYRGLHLDVARNFQEVDEVKKLIDIMAFYKLNTLHLHLTEDEGWRLEIPSLPELTEIGAYRKHASKEGDYLHPSYGSGPLSSPEIWESDEQQMGSSGSGFYTKEEFVQLLQYAKSRHISIIPEINFPGHARAAIKAMNVRHKRLMAAGKQEEAEQYWLIDPADTSVYLSAQHYTDNVSCVCKESVFDFYEKVLDEVRKMYEEAEAPLKIVHTGGDEVPKGTWEGSPICQEFLKEHPEIEDFAELEKYFHRRLAKMFADRNLQLAGWEEIAMNKDGSVNPEFVQDSFLNYVWNNLWGAQDLGYRMANAGYPVVLCNVTNLYFDLAYSNDPKEPGLYWGGFVDTRDAFSFMPYNVFTSTRTDNMGRKFNPARDFRGMEQLTAKGKAQIKGIQAQLWSETIQGDNLLDHYVLPKLIGMAEVAWNRNFAVEEEGPNAWEIRQKRWRELAWRIGMEDFRILDDLIYNLRYRIPPPGAFIRNDTLYANSLYPGLEIRYEEGQAIVFRNSPLYTKPVKVEGPVWLQVFPRKKDQPYTSSRTIKVEAY